MASSGMVMATDGTSWTNLLMVLFVATMHNLETLFLERKRFASVFLKFMVIMVFTSNFEETKVMRLLQSQTTEEHAQNNFPLAGKDFQQAMPTLLLGSRTTGHPETSSFEQTLLPIFALTNCLPDGNAVLRTTIAVTWSAMVGFTGQPATKLDSRPILFLKMLTELVVGEDLVPALTDQFIKSVTIPIVVAVWHVTVAPVEPAIEMVESGRGERSHAVPPMKLA